MLAGLSHSPATEPEGIYRIKSYCRVEHALSVVFGGLGFKLPSGSSELLDNGVQTFSIYIDEEGDIDHEPNDTLRNIEEDLVDRCVLLH